MCGRVVDVAYVTDVCVDATRFARSKRVTKNC